jgi:hypothetical protein
MKSLITITAAILLAGCSGIQIHPAKFRSARNIEPGPVATAEPAVIPSEKPRPTPQLTRHDCGIASLEHCAKLWEVDISATLNDDIRSKASSLASLAALAKRNGFDAFVLQAGSAGENPFKEITSHLTEERPLIILLRIPPGIGNMMSYVREAARDGEFSGDSRNWLRHFVVLTKCEAGSENGIAGKFTMMEPSRGEFRKVDSRWLDLFWRRQDAKYLLISK